VGLLVDSEDGRCLVVVELIKRNRLECLSRQLFDLRCGVLFALFQHDTVRVSFLLMAGLHALRFTEDFFSVFV